MFLMNAAKEEEEEKAKKVVVARNRPKLTPTVDGKLISEDQARAGTQCTSIRH